MEIEISEHTVVAYFGYESAVSLFPRIMAAGELN
jgi:hypothetical protein